MTLSSHSEQWVHHCSRSLVLVQLFLCAVYGWLQIVRRSLQTELTQGMIAVSTGSGPLTDHPLQAPTAGDASPAGRMHDLQHGEYNAQTRQSLVFHFHLVPEPHPLLSTPPDRCRT